MPFKSQAQRRLFHAKAARGELSRKTVEEWERHTPKGRLPERVGHTKSGQGPEYRPAVPTGMMRPALYDPNVQGVDLPLDVSFEYAQPSFLQQMLPAALLGGLGLGAGALGTWGVPAMQRAYHRAASMFKPASFLRGLLEGFGKEGALGGRPPLSRTVKETSLPRRAYQLVRGYPTRKEVLEKVRALRAERTPFGHARARQELAEAKHPSTAVSAGAPMLSVVPALGQAMARAPVGEAKLKFDPRERAQWRRRGAVLPREGFPGKAQWLKEVHRPRVARGERA